MTILYHTQSFCQKSAERKFILDQFNSIVCIFLFQLEKFRNHNSQWLCMVESQQHEDNNDSFNDQEVEQNDLDNYLRGEYLDNCAYVDDLYNSNSNSNNSNNKESEDNDSNNSNNPASPANSTYSRPISR